MNIWELHPALVHFPLALLLSATALDVAGVLKQRDSLTRLSASTLVVGIISALVAAVAGLVAYLTVPAHTEAAHVRLLFHALCAVSATLVYGVVLVMHSRPPSQVSGGRRVAVSLAAAGLLTTAGALGGYVVYQDGVGVEKAEGPAMGTWKFHLENLLGD